MKFLKLIPVTVFLSITGCDVNQVVDSCEDLETYSTEFDITGANIDLLIGGGETYVEGTEVEYNDIIFSIESETQMIAMAKEKSKGISFSLISSANACSLVPPKTVEKIVDIKITSSTAFNDSLATGDNLKSKFDVIYSDSETDYYDYINDEFVYYGLNRYLEQDDVYAGKTIQLKLNESPDFSGTHTFFIEFILNTGEVFTLETSEISFTQLYEGV